MRTMIFHPIAGLMSTCQKLLLDLPEFLTINLIGNWESVAPSHLGSKASIFHSTRLAFIKPDYIRRK